MGKAAPASALLQPGDAAPWFRAPSLGGRRDFVFDTVAGRHVLLLFLGSARRPETATALDAALARRALFDDAGACFFGVTMDGEDAASGRIAPQIPGIRYFLDLDGAVSRQYGAALPDGRYLPHWLLLDPALRVVGRFPLAESEKALDAVAAAVAAPQGADWAPVLLAPDILEPALCRDLIALYQRHGGEESGFMRERDGKTTQEYDPAHKRRRDHIIADPEVRQMLVARVRRRLVPMVKRVFQFEATRIERYLIGCYDAVAGGHFRPHRDNTTKGTAHRRFAVTINLNAEDYEGGDLRFPEYGRRTYRAPTGGAIVFSCSLLHEATPVTRGTRYAFLPFLYDEQASREREANNPHLAEDVGAYFHALPGESSG